MAMSPLTFTSGCAINKDMFYIACSVDEPSNSRDVPDSVMCFYQHQTEAKWFYHELPGRRVVSTAYHPPTDSAVREVLSLTDDGEIEVYSRLGSKMEKIAGAGLNEGRGYLNRLRVIDGKFYAVGFGQQVYARDSDAWTEISDGLAKSELEIDPALLNDPAALLASLSTSMSQTVDLIDIGGRHEEDLYVVGNDGFIAHRGAAWAVLDKKTDADLNSILLLSNGDAFIVGAKGTALRGNQKDGFKVVSRKAFQTDFYAAAEFGGVVYLGAGDGLYMCKNDLIERVDYDVLLDVRQIHTLETSEDVLWLVSEKAIARFDGQDWERFEHPNNA